LGVSRFLHSPLLGHRLATNRPHPRIFPAI
jgi:hypothetical protein